MTPKSIHREGDVLFLDMMQPREGKFPISRTSDGLICIIRIKTSEKKPFFEYGSTWLCNVVQVFENKLIVEPVELVKSKTENEHAAEKAAKAAFSKPKPERHKKVKANYQFKASYEK